MSSLWKSPKWKLYLKITTKSDAVVIQLFKPINQSKKSYFYNFLELSRKLIVFNSVKMVKMVEKCTLNSLESYQ